VLEIKWIRTKRIESKEMDGKKDLLRYKYPLAILMAVVSGLLLMVSVRAQQGQPRQPTDNEVNAVAKKLYCPVCPNTPLDVCETKACQDWRAQIRDQLAAGWDEKQIIDYFVAQYGERVLGEPQRKGFTSMVWVLPLLAILLGLVFIGQLLKSWKRRNAQEPAAVQAQSAQVAPEVQAKIEKKLKEID
jgi:cytochrome c-type biogenesis protein CcmH